jgi:microsomal dipeptidase-like Zn-dependent dipeptidase
MGWLFRGDFFGPLRADDWQSRFSSQANPETVERSGIGILVVALYANPLLTLSVRGAIREEIAQAERFVSEHPNWIIARSAAEARTAIDEGRKVLVLSLEGASGVLENEEDLREFVDEKGIRIVTFEHLTDDQFGGVAFLRGFRAMSTPVRWFIELFHPTFSDGVKVNTQRLTLAGRRMAEALLARKVWIDLSHSSDATGRDLIPLVQGAGQPLLYTHGGLRRFYRAERGFSDRQMAEVARDGGMIGLCPSEDVVDDTPVPTGQCGGEGCALNCRDGLPAFVEHYRTAVAVLGNENVVLGSDFNGAVPHLKPSCGTGTELDRSGLWHIGQTGLLWQAMAATGAPVPSDLNVQVRSFLDKWGQVTD